ncbi:MAG: MFS transporter [Vicinamibacterales bacterium]
MSTPTTTLTEQQARRNVVVCAATSCIGFTGFTLVMPFLPLYISQLGVTDVGQIAMWTGLTLGATPAVTAVSAPLWGRVGDRYGSKLLVIRSLGAFVLTKAAMAFVTAPWQLFALRALLGLFAGYGALTVSMAAESVPRDRMPWAIGFVQTGQRFGPAIGPVLGGLLAPVLGIRRAFLAASAFYLLAVAIVWFLYREPRARGRAAAAGRGTRAVFVELVRAPGFVLLLAVILALQVVDRSFAPVLPLYVAELGVPVGRVATVAGLLFSLGAIAAAFGHHLAGRLLRVHAARTVIAAAAVAGSAAMAVVALAPPVWVVGAAIAASGVTIGVGMTAAYAAAGALLPADAHATGFGFMTTASLVGLAVSPVLAGFVGAASLRVVFVLDVVLLLALAAVVSRRPARDAP